jgi:4-diphosphocytidyl-2-C-methyl-D-erythritol kinase
LPSVFCPAKLNLFLAVTGRRPDGFHDLVSIAAPVNWGDELEASADARDGFRLACDDPAVPTGADNLVIKAAMALAAVGGPKGANFRLEKRIPMEAGLGGGSSDAVAALRVLNTLSGEKVSQAALVALAASLGSDCGLFLAGAPAIMRGRGERIELLQPAAAARLVDRRVLIFKPGFGVPTPWAYSRLVESADYLSMDEAEARVAAWLGDAKAPAESILFNSFALPVFAKYPALPALFDRLRARFGLKPALSGSGSACFALLPEGEAPSVAAVAAAVREAWGASAWVVETRFS